MTTSGISARVARHWQAIDPLLPAPAARPPGCPANIVVAGRDGEPIAIGTCEHWEGVPGSLDLCWGAARRFQLNAQIAGPDVAAALDRLLSLWRDHLALVPEAEAQDTAAVVTWPSRDIDGVKPLLRHGLTPLTVAAVRSTGHCAGPGDGVPRRAAGDARSAGPPAAAPGGVRIRRAQAADIDQVVRLGLELIRFDAHFDCVIERPGAAEALRRYAARMLDVPDSWTWLAERDGTAVGMLSAEQPADAGWIAPMVGAAPVAYLMQMIVSLGDRGGGLGAALVAAAHREMEAAGVAAVLLHYGQLNPLSAPFWSRQGYRPLWTSWEARPARAIR
jgi:GNAT superfamily N-acetyltransferase